MALKATVLDAVKVAVQAIEDLAVVGRHQERTPTVYAPGGATVYTTRVFDVKVVVTTFNQREIEADRDLASDAKIMVFHQDGSPIPKLNDTLTVNGLQYRIMRSKPQYVGSEIGFSTVQARPLSA
jgi:hypothetical protein